MDPQALRQAFEKYGKLGRKPKAVLAVHLYGLCAQIEEIANICKEQQVPLIEDAAESLGTTWQGRYTGTFGDYGIISFNGNKIITSSGGGMLLVNTPDAQEKAAKVLYWSTQAREPARWYQHTEIGYNYRMSNIGAGIGRGAAKGAGTAGRGETCDFLLLPAASGRAARRLLYAYARGLPEQLLAQLHPIGG